MSTNVSLETGKLTDGHRTSFRSTTYRVICKKYKYNHLHSSWDIREIRRKNNDVLMTSLYGPTLPKHDHDCKAIIFQIIMSLVYINVMACQTIQKGIWPDSDNENLLLVNTRARG